MACFAIRDGSPLHPWAASRSSAITPGFKFASEVDRMWERYLPLDYQQIILNAVSPVIYSTKKELFFRLCNSPILLNGGTMSFWLDKQSAKKCYMLGAKELSISWGETPMYWEWISHPESRFSKVAKLLNVYWLDIKGKIGTRMLSPNTCYGAYLVFKIAEDSQGLHHVPMKASVRFVENETIEDSEKKASTVFLTVKKGKIRGELPRKRRDGWMEIKVGEFFNNGGDDGDVEMRLMEIKKLRWKSGLIVQGFELRPTEACAQTVSCSTDQPNMVGDCANCELTPEMLAALFECMRCSAWICTGDPNMVLTPGMLAALFKSMIIGFWLDKPKEKKCYMLGEKELSIAWGDTPNYWEWTSHPDSRFSKVAKLLSVCWLDIRGKIGTQMLTPNTCYVAYLVFQTAGYSHGLDVPMKASVRFVDNETIEDSEKRATTVFLTRERGWGAKDEELPHKRSDGWMEIKVGEFFNNGGDDGDVEMRLMEIKKLWWKSGLIVQGFELRPRNSLIGERFTGWHNIVGHLANCPLTPEVLNLLVKCMIVLSICVSIAIVR